jgi:hypothetical protein
MRLCTILMSAAAALALTATSAASAATLTTAVGPNSGSGLRGCSGDLTPKSGSTTVHSASTCFGEIGTASGEAIASTGHIGASAHADSHNGNSLSSSIGSLALYDDYLTFTSNDPNVTTASVFVNLLLDGILEATGPVSGGDVALFVSFGGSNFGTRFGLTTDGATGSVGDFILESGRIGASTDASLRTAAVVVPLNGPVHILLQMQTGVFASGPGSHALSSFGANSFKFAPTPFGLPDGVTVNAGDYIVDNHFIDPLAPAGGGVPEPAAWALMLLGFGAAGAVLRRRRPAVARA